MTMSRNEKPDVFAAIMQALSCVANFLTIFFR
jgi:hypothetical protein